MLPKPWQYFFSSTTAGLVAFLTLLCLRTFLICYFLLSPALWVWAATSRSSAQRSPTPTLFPSGLSAALKLHEALLSSGCTGCSVAGQQQPRLGHRRPGSAPSQLANTHHQLVGVVVLLLFLLLLLQRLHTQRWSSQQAPKLRIFDTKHLRSKEKQNKTLRLHEFFSLKWPLNVYK